MAPEASRKIELSSSVPCGLHRFGRSRSRRDYRIALPYSVLPSSITERYKPSRSHLSPTSLTHASASQASMARPRETMV
jgi:hypothetical protein